MSNSKFKTLQMILGLWGVFLSFSPLSFSARALDPAIAQQRLDQLHDQREKIEKSYARSLRELNDRISSQNIDPDAASDERFKLQSEYRRDLATVNTLEHDLLQSQQPPVTPPRPPAPAPRGISIPSQQIIEFGPSGNTVSAPEPPRQKNVGAGVRELEF